MPGKLGDHVLILAAQPLQVLPLGWVQVLVKGGMDQVDRDRGREGWARQKLNPRFYKIDMVKLGFSALTWLLQPVVHGPHSFSDCEKALAAGEEFAGDIWDEQDDMISHLELPWLGPSVIVGSLPLLGAGQVFVHSGKNCVEFVCMSRMYSMTELNRAGCSSHASLATSRSSWGRHPNS